MSTRWWVSYGGSIARYTLSSLLLCCDAGIWISMPSLANERSSIHCLSIWRGIKAKHTSTDLDDIVRAELVTFLEVEGSMT